MATLARPVREAQPTASTNDIPTHRSILSQKRSSSYAGADQAPHLYSQPVQNLEQSSCENRVKGALTEILNDEAVYSDEHTRRPVQDLLLKTERALREQRRKSLDGKNKGLDGVGLFVAEKK